MENAAEGANRQHLSIDPNAAEGQQQSSGGHWKFIPGLGWHHRTMGGGWSPPRRKTNPVGENHHKLLSAGCEVVLPRTLESPKSTTTQPLREEDEEIFGAFVEHFQRESAQLIAAGSSVTLRRVWSPSRSPTSASGSASSTAAILNLKQAARYTTTPGADVTEGGEGVATIELSTSV